MTSAIFARRGSNSVQKESEKLAWRNRTVRDKHGETIGKIEEIYVAEETASPDWALVRGCGVGSTSSFLPLHGSRSEGGEVIVPFTKTQVAGAPRTQEAGRLSPEQGAALYDHYGIEEAEPRPECSRLEGTGQKAIAIEQRLSDQISRFWSRWLSGTRGHNDSASGAKAAEKKLQQSRTEPTGT